MIRFSSCIVLLIVIAVPVCSAASAQHAGVGLYTTHATGHFNGDAFEDMIIMDARGTAALLLGKDGGYIWKTLLENETDQAVSAPQDWPAESSIFVTENGSGFDVYTRDLNGRIHQFSTSRYAE